MLVLKFGQLVVSFNVDHWLNQNKAWFLHKSKAKLSNYEFKISNKLDGFLRRE
jgi:hypothetical protein